MEQAFDGEDGVYLAETWNPDLIILDIMMPFLNGFEVISQLRGEGDKVPVIMLSARVETQDKVRGLKLGADDYMEKPFALEELVARIERRLNTHQEELFQFDEYSYNFDNSSLSKNTEKHPSTFERNQNFWNSLLNAKNVLYLENKSSLQYGG